MKNLLSRMMWNVIPLWMGELVKNLTGYVLVAEYNRRSGKLIRSYWAKRDTLHWFSWTTLDKD